MRNGHLNKSYLRRLGRVAVRLIFLMIITTCFCGCEDNSETVFHGYAEGDFILLASQIAGHLETLDVQQGLKVEKGAPLFSLDSALEQSAVVIAEQNLRQAKSRLEDLQKGQRPSELMILESRLDKAKASLMLSGKELERRKRLSDSLTISTEELDRAQTVYSRDQAALNELQAEYQTAKLGARSDAVEAARAELEAAGARLEQARWNLAQNIQYAPQTALVYETLYEPGEYVPSGYPVVSLLPAQNIKLRFFVPEPLLGSLSLGQEISVSFDGSNGSLPAVISFISLKAEYTPPVIYSRETRSKLVFMVEARPPSNIAEQLHPGQPVDIRLEPVHD
jgi:HlyD family secretion protein